MSDNILRYISASDSFFASKSRMWRSAAFNRSVNSRISSSALKQIWNSLKKIISCITIRVKLKMTNSLEHSIFFRYIVQNERFLATIHGYRIALNSCSYQGCHSAFKKAESVWFWPIFGLLLMAKFRLYYFFGPGNPIHTCCWCWVAMTTFDLPISPFLSSSSQELVPWVNIRIRYLLFLTFQEGRPLKLGISNTMSHKAGKLN